MASEVMKPAWGVARVLLLCMLLWLSVFAVGHGMPGGWTERSVSDPEIQKAAAFAVKAYNERSNSLFYSRLVEILQARSQVVEGIKYFLDVLLVNTHCDKRRSQGLTHADLDECPLPPKAQQQKQRCKFYVWSRPWLNDTRLTNMSCGPANS